MGVFWCSLRDWNHFCSDRVSEKGFTWDYNHKGYTTIDIDEDYYFQHSYGN